MNVRPANAGDRRAWTLLRSQLWPTCTEREHAIEMSDYLQSKGRLAVFLAERPDSTIAGFVEVSMRPMSERADYPRIGYLEGLFVERKSRRHGVARALVRAAEGWARSLGAEEMGSDTGPDRRSSRKAHRALGYRERERLIVFTKRLR